MSKVSIIKSLMTEYGIGWAFNRTLYSCKLKMLNIVPTSEFLFEKKVTVERIDIFNTNVKSISAFLKNLSQQDKENIIQTADKAVSGIIKGFSSVELDYGNLIDWQLNPLNGKCCSEKVKWYRINDFDKERGDIKLIWEASRFTHFYYFARAYMLTSDIKYYEAFSRQLDDWLKNNTYSYGANYKCGQECALRMMNTLRNYSVFKAYDLCDDNTKANVIELVSRCYRKILSNFFYAHRCIKNNHTLSELCGMIIGAWCCEDSRTLKKAYRLFNREIENQFTPDGGYRQFSFNYQRFALQICECVMSLSSMTGIKLDNTSMERIKRSALLMYQCQSESGDLPNYGSNDGALIFPVTSCEYRDFRPVINTIIALTEGKRIYQTGAYDEELLWFGYNNIEFCNVKRESSKFSEAGLYTLRNADSFAMICLNNYTSRPAHMDQLHFDLWYKDKNIFCDCGTYSYASELGKRLALTESHNTLKAAKTEQMNKHGNFLICNWSKAKNITGTECLFEGTMISQNGYSHKRHVEKTYTGYTITDEVNGTDKYEIIFQTPYKVTIHGDTAIISDDKNVICTLQCNRCEMYTTIGYRSLYYMSYNEITVIHLKFSDTNIKNNIKINLEVKVND